MTDLEETGGGPVRTQHRALWTNSGFRSREVLRRRAVGHGRSSTGTTHTCLRLVASTVARDAGGQLAVQSPGQRAGALPRRYRAPGDIPCRHALVYRTPCWKACGLAVPLFSVCAGQGDTQEDAGGSGRGQSPSPAADLPPSQMQALTLTRAPESWEPWAQLSRIPPPWVSGASGLSRRPLSGAGKPAAMTTQRCTYRKQTVT